MKIITRGVDPLDALSVPFKLRCNVCNTLIEAEDKELQREVVQVAINETKECYFIECPICKEKIKDESKERAEIRETLRYRTKRTKTPR